MKWIKKIWNYIHAFLLKWVLNLRSQLRMQSLRDAIAKSDRIKEETGRKVIVPSVLFDGSYEAIEKKKLKLAANAGKNKNNAALTPGRLKMMKKKKRVVDPALIKSIEKRSAYVTN